MTSSQLVLQLTYALLAFAAVSGSPSRFHKGKASDDDSSKDVLGSFDITEDCTIAPLPDDISFFYYTKQFRDGNILALDALPVQDIIMSTYTKIVTHGMRSNLSAMDFLFDAYIDSEDEINVIALDWSSRTKGMYRKAAEETAKIGKMVADSLVCYLYKYYDIYPNQLHFIGHDLGAHLFATTAREASARVGRLTGLDPARLCFEDNCYSRLFPGLTKNDAIFVDVLHTDAGNMGVANSHGTADVYANYGSNQTLCQPVNTIPSPYCNSFSSIVYFATSIQEPFKVLASACSKPYPLFDCDHKSTHLWGEHIDSSARGVFNFFFDIIIKD